MKEKYRKVENIEDVSAYEVTKDNIDKVKNNSLIVSYAPNRKLEINIGDFIITYEFYTKRESLIHCPKHIFKKYYKKL